MKRIALCVLAAALLVAFSVSVAYADTTSHYETWATTTGSNSTTPTPHKGYATGTVKCAVCHAVHKGNSAGQVLLDQTVANACTYCHIDNAIGNIRIYGGVATNYTSANVYGHGGSGATCSDCHAVHGANTITNSNFSNISTRILRNSTGGGLQTNPALPAGYAFATGTDRDGVITAFCSQCHPYYQPSVNGTIGLAASGIGQGTDNVYQSHIMNTAGDTYVNAAAVGYTGHGRVAQNDSTHCRDCHDAGVTLESGSYVPANNYQSTWNFPHYTAQNARFLNSAAYSGAPTATLTNASADGACLKCHIWGGGATGVGLTY
jgi:predicted CXXCH cytochrome family protein